MDNEKAEGISEIGAYIRKAENDFTSGTTRSSKYVSTSLYEDINKIYAYLESKHTTGETDSLGREKPFFNVVVAARNVRFRATDIDRKDIKIRSTKASNDIGALLATLHLRAWMRRNNFGQFLNSWGLTLSGFNEAVVKFVEKDGELVASVVPWSRIICDQIDFNGNPKIEVLELTEAQLKKNKDYDKEAVESLCNAKSARETIDGQDKDAKSEYIKLYELHGEFPLSYLTGKEEDEEEYVPQMHVVSFIASKDGKTQDFTLYSGREKSSPYMLTALMPEPDGSVAVRGVVKEMFDVQWMQNHSVKAIKDQLDLASKLLFQTSDGTFVGQNVFDSIENGAIMIHKPNEPLTQLANSSHDITSLQNFSVQWKNLGNELAGVSESMLGANPPSGTAWRQTEALLQESHSLFNVMTENKGLAIEQMLREHIIPHLKKKMDTSDEIAETLSDDEITKIDSRYIKNMSIRRTNEVLKEKILNGEDVSTMEQDEMMAESQDEIAGQLADQGGKRYFSPSEIPDKTWKEIFKDLEWDVEVDVTNENLDQDALTTLSTVLGIVTDPVRSQALQTPAGRTVLNKILRMTGAVSTAEMASLSQPQPVAPQAPTAPTPPGGVQLPTNQEGGRDL